MLAKNSKMRGIDETGDVLPEKAEKGSKANVNRASRNKSEKDRRDKVNAFINELANLVPGCSPQSKKLDKATILKNTVDFMKVHNDLTVAITRKDTTSCLNSNELGQLMLEGYHAFLFVISLSGSFKFVSESVYDLLGYMKDDLVMKNVFDYLTPEDKLILLKQISQDSKTGTARNSGSSSFYIRFKRKLDGIVFYETLRCCGNFRTVKEDVKSTDDGNTALSSNESCFVVLAKLIHPHYQRDVTNWLSIDVEFSSRQSLEGKFLYLDPRCIPITGYLPYEILGSMIYEYIHYDDLENISKSFEALLEEGEGETEDYRILTKGCQWIVIKTSSYISYNHWNSKPEYICSTHQLVRKRAQFVTREAKTEGSSNIQVDEISSASLSDRSSTWKIENFADGKSDVASELNMSSTLLQNSQTKDSFTKKVSSTAVSSSQETNKQDSSYCTIDSQARETKGSSFIPQATLQQNIQTSQSIIENNPRDYAGSDRNGSNLIPNCQQSNLGSRDGMIEKSRQSPGAVAATYWSGQSISASPYDRFQNPLSVISQSRLENAERLTSTSGETGSVRIDRYSQSPRASQGYAEPPAEIATGYTHVSTENTSNMWHIASQPKKSPDTPSEFSQPGSQLPHGYFPSSSVNPERTFQPPRQRLSGIFQSSNFPGSVLPPSSPAAENYPSSPITANIMSPHGSAGGRHSQSSPDIPAEYPTVTTRAIHSYPISPSRVSSQSPQSYPTTDGYFSSVSSPSSPYPRTLQGYPPSNTQYPSQSSVPTLVGDRYSHSSAPLAPVTFPLTSPYSSASPQSPDNSIVSSQSPHYTASSASLTSPHHQSPARPYHIPTGSSELYTISSQSSTNYPLTLYDHPDRCPLVSGLPTERYLQPALSPHSMPQNTLNQTTSPDCNPLRSPALPPVRDNVFIEQSAGAPRSSQLGTSLVNDLSRFPLQSDQQDLPGVYHVTQVKKSGEESLRPCQIGSDCLGSQNTTVRSPVDPLDGNYQTADQFSSGQNNETRSRTVSQHKAQNMSYESQTSDQTSQQPQEQTFNSMQNVTVNMMAPTTNVNSTYVQARRILQNQLLEKQNHLQNVIQSQKAQLNRIQEQIILNAQAQFSINDISDLESTKQLQQQVYDLESELKQQETKQKELKSIFIEKVGRGLAGGNDGEMHPGGISTSSLAYSDDMSRNPLKHAAQRSSVPSSDASDQSNSNFPEFSEVPVNVSVNIPTKAHSKRSGSVEIANKSEGSPQDTRQTSLNEEFAEEDDLFSGVLQHDKGRLSLSGHYSPVATPQSISPHYKTSSNVVLPQNNSRDLSLNQHRRNSSVNANTRENFGSPSNKANDYFSKFTASELETFLSSTTFPSTGASSTHSNSSSSDDNVGKEETTSPSTYDSLLLQQKRLLEMQEEQRRQLVRRQHEQLSRLQQRQQQQQQRVLLQLQHTPETTEQDNLESQILSHGGVIAEDTASSVLSQELSDEDLSVVNMLLNEEVGIELWTDEIFDKTTSAT